MESDIFCAENVWHVVTKIRYDTIDFVLFVLQLMVDWASSHGQIAWGA